ncbi:cyclin-dependent kinases regulatory subunit 1 [Lepidochelys kempii]|uniref:cyclin-dependent kinases regulatory subunit 1 n=1 Tax=Lepidochelys kempii TaxID=8472 RepID=UPI003C6ECB6F
MVSGCWRSHRGTPGTGSSFGSLLAWEAAWHPLPGGGIADKCGKFGVSAKSKDLARLVPKTHLMSESEWRNLGVQQSQGWVHYMVHEPEPHILLFRRPLPKKPEK